MDSRSYMIKEGVGSHYKDGKRYSSGDVVELDEYQASRIMHKLIPLGPEPEPEPEPDPTFDVLVRPDGEGYDVVNMETGEPINDTPLTKAEATEIAGG
jgi:hypothetical protein